MYRWKAHWLTAAVIGCLSFGQVWAQDAVAPEASGASGRVLSTQDVRQPAQREPSDGGAEQDSVLATAGAASMDDIKSVFERRFPDVAVEGVTETPFPGLYEVQIGTDVVYTDASVSYVLQGTLIDAKRRIDLTEARLKVLSQVDFSSLPLDIAIKQVKGDGSRKMVVFEDPNCGYCKRLHQTLKDIDNITVYTILFPILTPDSSTKARDIWCASDPAAAWQAWMLDGRKPQAAKCDAPLQQALELGRSLRVQGTPALFFPDGSRINGAMPREIIEEKLDSLSKKTIANKK